MIGFVIPEEIINFLPSVPSTIGDSVNVAKRLKKRVNWLNPRDEIIWLMSLSPIALEVRKRGHRIG